MGFPLAKSLNAMLKTIGPYWYSYVNGLLFNEEGLLLWLWIVRSTVSPHLLCSGLNGGGSLVVVFSRKMWSLKARFWGEYMWKSMENVPFAIWESVHWKRWVCCTKGQNTFWCKFIRSLLTWFLIHCFQLKWKLPFWSHLDEIDHPNPVSIRGFPWDISLNVILSFSFVLLPWKASLRHRQGSPTD